MVLYLYLEQERLAEEEDKIITEMQQTFQPPIGRISGLDFSTNCISESTDASQNA